MYGQLIPTSFRMAVSSAHADKWWKVMQGDRDAGEASDGEIVDSLLEGRKAIGNQWMYALKFGPDDPMSDLNSVRRKVRRREAPLTSKLHIMSVVNGNKNEMKHTCEGIAHLEDNALQIVKTLVILSLSLFNPSPEFPGLCLKLLHVVFGLGHAIVDGIDCELC